MEKKKNTRVAHIREILTKKKMQKIENIPTFNQKLKKRKVEAVICVRKWVLWTVI